jgi:hypothetical protein
MCSRCDVTRVLDEEEFEASALLLMLINKIHAAAEEGGGVHVSMDLSDAEFDWLCAWGAVNEDAEEDDPLEEDMPPEESEQLETDSRIRF